MCECNGKPVKNCGTCEHISISRTAYRTDIKCNHGKNRGQKKSLEDVCDEHVWASQKLAEEYRIQVCKAICVDTCQRTCL